MPATKNEFDIGPLSWVKPEIELALRRAEEGIKRLDGTSQDHEIARSTLAHLHQVSGALLMVGLEPIARVSEAAEKLIEVVSHGDIQLTSDLINVLRETVTSLSRYLESLMRGEPHRPLVLFNYYKKLLNANGKDAHEVDLFYPDLSRRPKFISKEGPRLGPQQLQALIALKRAEYQRSLLNLLRDQNIPKSLAVMRNALATVEATQSPDTRMLWWIAGGFIDGLIQQEKTLDTATKQLCGRIDLQIKRYAEGNDTISERLIRELLFAVAEMEPSIAKISEIQETYGLKSLLPPTDFARPDNTSVENALHKLSEQIDELKETWLKFASGNHSALQQFIEETLKIKSAAKEFDNQPLQKAFDKVDEIANSLGSNNKNAGEALSLEMATALLMLKDAVDNYAHLGSEFSELIDTAIARLDAAAKGQPLPAEGASKLAEISRAAQEKILLSQLGQEILTNLNHIEQALDVFFRDPQKRADLADLPSLINQVIGALSILECKDAVSLLQATRTLVQNFVNNPGPADPRDAELTAEAFSNLGLFISALQQGRENPEAVLHPVLQRFNITPTQSSEKEVEPEQISVSETIIEIDVDSHKRRIVDLFEKWQRDTLSGSIRKELREILEGFSQEAMLVGNSELTTKYNKAQAALEDAAAQPSSVRDLIVDIVGQGVLSEPAVAAAPVSNVPVGVVAQTNTAEIDAELLEIFLEEATEVLEGIAIHQDVIKSNASDKEAFTVIRRGFHTLKGSGRMVGLNDLGEVAWQVEQVMNKWLRDEKPVNAHLLRLIDDAQTSFRGWVAILKEGGNPVIEAEGIFKLADQLKNDQVPDEEVIAEVTETPVEITEISFSEEPIASDEVVEIEEPIQAVEEPVAVVQEQQAKVVIGDIVLDPEFFEIFATEAKIHVATLQQQLAAIRSESSKNVNYDFMRAAHTLTGISRTCGFMPVADLGFSFEKYLLEKLEHPAAFNENDLSLITQSVEELTKMVDDVLQRTPPLPHLELIAQIETHLHESRTQRWEQEAKGLHAGEEADESANDEYVFANVDLSDSFVSESSEVSEDAAALPEESRDHEIDLVADSHLEEPSSEDALVESLSDEPLVEEVTAEEQQVEESSPEVVADEEMEEVEVSAADIEATHEEERSTEIHSLVDEGELVSSDEPLVEEVTAEEQQVEEPLSEVVADEEMEEVEVSAADIEATHEEEQPTEIHSLVDEGELVASEALSIEDAANSSEISSDDAEESTDNFEQTPSAAFEAEQVESQPETPEEIVEETPVAPPISTFVKSPLVSEPVNRVIDEVDTSPVETGKDRRVIVDDIDEQLLPIFLEEAFDLLPEVNDSLRNWRASPEDKTPANLLARHLHTLKGSARMAGIMRLGELVHVIESNAMSMHSQAKPADTLFDSLEEGIDRFASALEKLKAGEKLDNLLLHEPTAAQQIAIETAVSDPRASMVKLPATALAAKAAAAPAQGEEDRRAVLRVRADLVDRFVNDAGEISIARSRIESEMNFFRQGLTELGENVIKLRAQLREIEIQAESQIQSSIGNQQEVGDDFDPLEFDRFTRMQELTRFMAESVHDFVTLQQSLRKNLDEADAALASQSRLNRDLQQDLMSVRMVPLGNLADRFYRVVRQTAKELGKKANLEFKGMRTELDRSVLEQIVAPFEHLLRNAISHGIESPQVREAAGKSPIGEITIDSRQEANEIVLTFTDDGGGIDAQRIRAKAIEKGMLSPDEHIDDKQLIDFIFMPGFSTAEHVTQIAGRGVGMDVVKSAILTLGGRFEVETVLGQGTKFIITLPLTLAVTQVLLIRANGTLFAIPSAMIELVQQRKVAEIESIRQNREVVWQNHHYPFSSLTHLLGEEERPAEPRRYFPVLLLRSGAHRAAVEIDSIEGNREIVVKTIGPQLSRLTGITGATVLGNGQVVLILNPVMLAGRYEGTTPAYTEAKKVEIVKAPLVMVVDDSLTVRKITSRLLLREGYQVVTAKDGVDALQQLQEFIPDIMLLDIEMPRMDGFELMRNVRADARTAKVPIIMITSRTAEKHRNYAFELGVNEYLGKPFQEDDLLSHIARFTGTKEIA